MNLDLYRIYDNLEFDKYILSTRRQKSIRFQSTYLFDETLFRCVRLTCLVRSDGLLNAFEQSGYSHGYGFSPKRIQI